MHKVEVRTVTLTFDIATSFLFATHCHVMIVIEANYLQIQICITKLWVGHKKVSLQVYAKGLSGDCDLDL